MASKNHSHSSKSTRAPRNIRVTDTDSGELMYEGTDFDFVAQTAPVAAEMGENVTIERGDAKVQVNAGESAEDIKADLSKIAS